MEFHVDCHVCGKSISVREGAAGANLRCECGREVAVPDLATLRLQAGLPPHEPPPPQVIDRMLRDGELPAGEGCLCCDRENAEIVELVAECEKRWVETKGGISWAALLLGALVWTRPETVDYTEGLLVPAPVRLCDRCRRLLSRQRALSGLRVLKYVLLVAAIIIALFVLFWVGLLLVGATMLIWAAEGAVRKSRQANIKNLLRHVPIYRRLLDIYPDTIILDPDGKLVLG
jgi:hypothetical protein